MPSIDEAFARLNGALSLLEASVARRVEADDARGDHATELMLLEEDRARLAAELDAASARLARVSAATGAIGTRVDRAIETIGQVIGRASPTGRA